MKEAGNEIILWPIDQLQGADYNPRKMVPERLEQVRVSLAKLGFVLPIYITPEGLILSGHQRTTAAKMHGYTRVPVVVVNLPAERQKGLNVVFNKGTNDLDTYETNAKDVFSEYLEKSGELLTNLPDIAPDTVFPCMQTELMTIGDLMVMCGGGLSENLRQAGTQLVGVGVHMPIVVSEGKIINGLGRTYGFSNCNYDLVPVVNLPKEKADYAYLALNFLAMDFDIQANFKEELRFNAFRRRAVQNQIVGLSRTYLYFVYGRVVSNTAKKADLLEGIQNKDLELLPTYSEEARKAVARKYGRVIFDMGAGLLHDARLMQEAGFDLTPFEPYYCPPGKDQPCSDASRELASKYLDRMEELAETGTGPNSIISSFVLNSIPHHRDRMAYLIIVAAMARYDTGLYLGTQNVKSLASLDAHLRLNSDEPNVTLGNDTRFFKAQKFYYKEELERMLKTFFTKVTIKEVGSNVFAECHHPKRPNPKLLGEAIELEFNLPYKDGTTMNLVERAKEVFSKYLNVEIP